MCAWLEQAKDSYVEVPRPASCLVLLKAPVDTLQYIRDKICSRRWDSQRLSMSWYITQLSSLPPYDLFSTPCPTNDDEQKHRQRTLQAVYAAPNLVVAGFCFSYAGGHAVDR